MALTLGAPSRALDTPHGKAVLYLAIPADDGCRFVAARRDMAVEQANLVVVTHGWYERQRWPAALAGAIWARTNRHAWCCGWYDWRTEATRFFPRDAARLGRDSTGPHLGRTIVALSRDWSHVHLIGHSAGAWVVSEAARIIGRQTSASIHLTFLDAYVPRRWDQADLGDVVDDPNVTCWVEHYLTHDPILNLTEAVLPHACNVDVTAINPGFNGHKFPWHWYHATVVGRFVTEPEIGGATVQQRANDLVFGFARARESGEQNWQQSLRLALGREVIGLRPE